MTATDHRLEIGALGLLQVDWLPDGTPHAAAIFVHGHGDSADRHAGTIKPLLDRGIACTAVDLPGHGRSPGPRGDIPGFASIDRILTAARGGFEKRIGLPVEGWAAHSMGALLTIHHLSKLAPPAPRFLWLNSPLVDVGAGRSSLAQGLTRCFGKIFPRLPIRTGVRISDCRSKDDEFFQNQDATVEFGHDRITLGWANELLQLSASLPAATARLDPSIRLLVTQGLEDPVCPPQLGRRLFDQMPMESKRWIELPGARHEAFSDSNISALHQAVETWLDQDVLVRLPRPDTTRGT